MFDKWMIDGDDRVGAALSNAFCLQHHVVFVIADLVLATDVGNSDMVHSLRCVAQWLAGGWVHVVVHDNACGLNASWSARKTDRSD